MGSICNKEPKEVINEKHHSPTQIIKQSPISITTKVKVKAHCSNRNVNNNNNNQFAPIHTSDKDNYNIATDRTDMLTINPELPIATLLNTKSATISNPRPSQSSTKRKSKSNTHISINTHINTNTNRKSKGKSNTRRSIEIPNNEAKILQFIKRHNRDFEDSKLIELCLMNNSFLCSLDKQAINEIVKQMSLCFIPKDTIIFKQGMIGSYYYIIKQGSVQLLINDKPIKSLSEGDNFGELALLYGAPRSGTIIAETDCYLWVMERKNFKKIVDHITCTNYEENKQFLQENSVLSLFESAQRSLLCASLYKEVFEMGSKIVMEGELASCVYFIREGEVDIGLDGNEVITLGKGQYFGERSMIMNTTRMSNAIAKTKCICFSLSLTAIKNILGEDYRRLLVLMLIKGAFNSSKVFNSLHLKMLDRVFTLFKLRAITKGETAYNEGYITTSKVVVIISGSLITAEEVQFTQGTILFESNILNALHTQLDQPIKANPDCLIAEANSNDILSSLHSSSFINLLDKSSVIDSIQQVSLFKNLTQTKLHLLVNQLQISKYAPGANIITQGEEGSKFFIVKKGKIDISINGKYIRTINQNDYFGERALFFKEPRSASATANDEVEVEVYYLEKDDFLSCIEDNMKHHLLNRLFLQDNTIELSHLDYIDTLGSGNYGVVALVQVSKTKYRYAIKCIAKKQIESEQLISNLALERSILLQIDHPFIVKLVKTLKDSNSVFFLMEYIKGKELFDVIRDIGLLNKSQAQFIGASIMLAVEYLHEKKIIYRDIKPENVMICDNGYVKLIDFGTARIISNESDTTSTVIGTPHYMAPEVVLGEGYSFQVDYWSIAVCLYEFICGVVPFGEAAEEPMEVYMAIINDQLSFPSHCKDYDFKQLMTHMLCKNPLSRVAKMEQIKNMGWFHNFDWEALMSLDLKSVVVPVLNRSEKQNASMSYIEFLEKLNKQWNGNRNGNGNGEMKENKGKSSSSFIEAEYSNF